ncbi:MAG: T9SS type A sorting domain-containing protein [Ginsengibacter sp.]
MKKYFTLISRSDFQFVLLFICLFFASASSNAQVNCANGTVLWSEDFGSGNTSTSSPDILTTGLSYEEFGDLSSEGTYRIINGTQQKPEWQISNDHTGNVNGRMIVANGQPGEFYLHTVSNTHGFTPGNYAVGLFLMNIDSAGVCTPDPLLPVITFTVEYLSQSNTWVALGGSPYTAPPVQQSVSPAWINLGSGFTLPSTGSFFPTQIRITIENGTIGGCGNDFAMDDVSLSLCPEGAPTPVELVSFTALQTGNAVNLDWSTSQELNNNYFLVERNADGNSGWIALTKVNGAGNSQMVRNYHVVDANPLSGINYYRLKQVDMNGDYQYSRIVNAKIDGQRTFVSVLANPFHNNLSINFVNANIQLVSARLTDITGKQVASEQWSIPNGNSRKDFSNVNNLQQGVYILTIRNNLGEPLYNAKIVKQ